MRHTAFASILFAILVLCCTASATVIPAPPSIPMSVKGTVDITGVPAPVGTIIQANGTNVRTGVSGNPFTLTTAGTLGGGTWDPQMFIQGSGLATGTAISFTIDGQPAMVRQAGSPDWTTYVSFTSGGVCTVELDTGPDPSSSPSGLPPTPAVEPTVPEPTPHTSSPLTTTYPGSNLCSYPSIIT